MDENERNVLTEMLLLMDKYDLYGSLALPKRHDPETDIPVLYRVAASSGGVFVNPALVENFGITLIEASSSGLPVVSTDHGGPQDIIGNCESGILIDSSKTEEISEALKKILVDKELWREYSNNGINGVREHYAWDAHCNSYMELLKKPLSKSETERTGVQWRTTIGKHLSQIDKLFITDIDYTLLGDDEALAELVAEIRGSDTEIGFGLATGRSFESVKEVLERYDLPSPDIIISSVGSEMYYGPDHLPDQGYQRHISYGWKPDKIRKVLSELDFLNPQEDKAQRKFKISYYLEDSGDYLERIHKQLSDAKLRYNLIYSHGQFLDILPHRASKGKAIKYLCYKWGISPEQVAVSGDSGNDEEMLRGNFKGIIVGNHSEELERLRGKKRIYFAEGHYAKGVLEGLKHYGFLPG